MRTYSNTPLNRLEPVGDGSYFYRWNIVENKVSEELAGMRWSADEVVVSPPITANTILESVIGAMWPTNYEQKLINEYNAAILGISDGEVADRSREAYVTFLSERAELKARVEADCKEYNIE